MVWRATVKREVGSSKTFVIPAFVYRCPESIGLAMVAKRDDAESKSCVIPAFVHRCPESIGLAKLAKRDDAESKSCVIPAKAGIQCGRCVGMRVFGGMAFRFLCIGQKPSSHEQRRVRGANVAAGFPPSRTTVRNKFQELAKKLAVIGFAG